MEETKQRTPNPNDVIEAEKKHLGLDGNDKVSGFAISGGGIRSASFGLGVMQALVSNNQLEKMDYMSTVSGGGYLGSALTWALKQDKNAGTTPETFPLGKKVAPNQINNKGDSLFQKKYGIAKHGFAIADIKYQDGSIGTLVYVKLAMIEGLSTDVYSYKGVHPSFPHESTADQFFDEKQFEAYRELGYYVAWQMMESEAGKAIFS